MSDYAELKDRYDKLVRQRDMAIAKNEQAEEQLRKIIEEIKTNFGVSSLEEAKSLLRNVEKSRDKLEAQIREELDKVDG